MAKAAEYGQVMEWIKRQPCLIRGTPGVDAAHLSPLVRRGPTGPRVRRTLDRAGTSHQGWLGLIAVPLSADLHRPTSDNPNAQHRMGLEEWLREFGLTETEIAWEVARLLATYIAKREGPPT